MGPDRFGKCYRDSSNWIILALDNREPVLVIVTGINQINTHSVGMYMHSRRRIMKLHEEQLTALVICVVIIGCFVVARYMWL